MNKYAAEGKGDQSSRLSSSRGVPEQQMQFLHSGTSQSADNEDILSGIPALNGNRDKGNILSFLSGNADDMSLVLQME